VSSRAREIGAGAGRALAGIVLSALMTACAGAPAELTATAVERYPHDPGAFTQGLLLADGLLYESTGLYGASSLREVDPATGRVIRIRPLPANLFAEGLALVGDRLVQLTWREGRAIVYSRETFDQIGGFRYQGEGWGLCFDGEALWMSDGSSQLTVRDPQTFEVLRRQAVTSGGEPVPRLNELECVGEHVYANVWQTDTIVRIVKASGRVDATIDAAGLLAPDQRAGLSPDAVLNGIAYDPENDRFLVTGKLWPVMLEVRFE
jgi:glutamine cyclotransferase